MKLIFQKFILCALAGISTSSYGLVNLGDGGEINLSTTGSVFWDTAIRSRNSGQEDTIYTLRNTLTWSRPSRLFDMSASVGLTIQRYQEFDEFDDENVSLNVNFSPSQTAELRTSSITVSGDLILESRTEVDQELGEIISKRTYGVSFGLLYDPNSSYNLRFQASGTREDPDSSVYNEIDRLSFGTTLEIPVNADTVMEFGGNYLETQSDQALNSQGETITAFAGLNGLLLPKLRGFVRAGIQNRETSSLGSDTAPYASSGLTWAIDETTSASLVLSHDFGTTINDQASETTSASVSLRRQLNRRLSGNAGLNYSESDLTAFGPGSRTTESIGLSAGVSYSLNNFSSLNISASYSDSSSTDSQFDFDRWRIGASVSARW
jgi:hypothetical protein